MRYCDYQSNKIIIPNTTSATVFKNIDLSIEEIRAAKRKGSLNYDLMLR